MENLLTNELETELISYPQVFDVVSFMCAGVVGYSDVDDGTYLLRKETLEKMLPSIIGRPVIVEHQEITKENIKSLAVGYVTGTRYNQESGQFDCSIIVTDAEIAEKIRQGNNKVSSAYTVTEFGGSGRYSGIEYDAEILDGNFTHLAIVDNPRYPDGKILINNLTKNKGVTMFFKLNKQNEEETKEQKVNEEDLIEVDGDKVELKDLIDAYKNACKKNEEEEEKKENKRNEEEEENKSNEETEKKDEDKENEDSDDDLVSKVTKIVEKILAEKTQEDEEKKENKKNEDDEKTNKISSYEKSNSLRQASKLCVVDTLNYKTRAEKIAESNKKYSL